MFPWEPQAGKTGTVPESYALSDPTNVIVLSKGGNDDCNRSCHGYNAIGGIPHAQDPWLTANSV
jgi:hypothetical protein